MEAAADIGAALRSLEIAASHIGALVDGLRQHARPDEGGVRPRAGLDQPRHQRRDAMSDAVVRYGLGLGLGIARTIVHAHQGTMALTSRPGCTVFDVRLPSGEEER